MIVLHGTAALIVAVLAAAAVVVGLVQSTLKLWHTRKSQANPHKEAQP